MTCWCKRLRASCRVRLVIGGPGSIPGRDVYFSKSALFSVRLFVCLFVCLFICSFIYLFIYFSMPTRHPYSNLFIRHVGHSLLNKPILTRPDL